MKFVFFFFGIFALLYEIMVLVRVKDANSFFSKIRSDIKTKDFNDLTDTQKTFTVLTVLYSLWVLVGLFSSQWVLFVVYLMISIIPKKTVFVRFVDAIVSVLLLLFILINTFHLHINLFDAIVNYIK